MGDLSTAEEWAFRAGQLREERDGLLRRLAEVERERDEEVSRLCGLVNHEMADAEKWQRQATAQVQEIIQLKAERDDARRVAKRLARSIYPGPAVRADRDTALAYEVEP